MNILDIAAFLKELEEIAPGIRLQTSVSMHGVIFELRWQSEGQRKKVAYCLREQQIADMLPAGQKLFFERLKAEVKLMMPRSEQESQQAS